MIQAELTYELSRCSDALREYARLSDLDEADIIAKQGGKLAWNISSELKKLAPVKGSIRAERLVALAAGEGIHVREAVKQEIGAKYQAVTSIASGKTFLSQRRGKRVVAMATEVERKGKMLNLQALMVEREIAIREGARGFAAYATPKPPRSYASIAAEGNAGGDKLFNIESKYGFVLSKFSLKLARTGDKSAELSWIVRRDDSYEDAVMGLETERQQAALLEGIRQTTADIEVYVKRKNEERAHQTGLN
jgi:hypothetical protein